jgi:hypothetical protein
MFFFGVDLLNICFTEVKNSFSNFVEHILIHAQSIALNFIIRHSTSGSRFHFTSVHFKTSFLQVFILNSLYKYNRYELEIFAQISGNSITQLKSKKLINDLDWNHFELLSHIKSCRSHRSVSLLQI